MKSPKKPKAKAKAKKPAARKRVDEEKLAAAALKRRTESAWRAVTKSPDVLDEINKLLTLEATLHEVNEILHLFGYLGEDTLGMFRQLLRDAGLADFDGAQPVVMLMQKDPTPPRRDPVWLGEDLDTSMFEGGPDTNDR